jgi:hypothetical protein
MSHSGPTAWAVACDFMLTLHRLFVPGAIRAICVHTAQKFPCPATVPISVCPCAPKETADFRPVCPEPVLVKTQHLNIKT